MDIREFTIDSLKKYNARINPQLSKIPTGNTGIQRLFNIPESQINNPAEGDVTKYNVSGVDYNKIYHNGAWINNEDVEVVDNLNSTAVDKALSANQGYTLKQEVNTKYTYPGTGIPKVNLATGVQGSLDKADSSVQARLVGSVEPVVTPGDYLSVQSIVNNLTSGGTQDPLSAEQGKVLKQLIDAGYLYMGLATTSTNPGTPTQKVFYIANEIGTYTNFGSIVLSSGLHIFRYDLANNSWVDEELSPSLADFKKLPIIVSKYSIQSTVWWGSQNNHIVIPVNEGDKITSITGDISTLYFALLTDYVTPVEGVTPSFVSGYESRQSTSSFPYTIPTGTKYVVFNNVQHYTSIKINGIEILNGIWSYLLNLTTSVGTQISTLSTKINTVESNNAWVQCYTAANTSDKTISAAGIPDFVLSKNVSLLVMFMNGNTADNVTFMGKPLYYRGVRASSTNHWNAYDTISVVYYIGNDSFYSEPWNGVALSSEVSSLASQITGSIQESDLLITILSDNLANPDNIYAGMIDSVGTKYGGTEAPVAGNWNMIKLDVTPGQIISFGGFYLGRAGYAGFFNGDTLISFFQFAISNGNFNGNNLNVTVPEGATVLWIDISSPQSPSDPYDNLMINYGPTLKTYDEYSDAISKIKGIPLIGSSSGEGISDLVIDLPVSDGTDISVGYAYIESSTGNIKAKMS